MPGSDREDRDKDMLPGPKKLFWPCTGCGEQSNYAYRRRCRKCNRWAPQKVQIQARRQVKKVEEERRERSKPPFRLESRLEIEIRNLRNHGIEVRDIRKGPAEAVAEVKKDDSPDDFNARRAKCDKAKQILEDARANAMPEEMVLQGQHDKLEKELQGIKTAPKLARSAARAISLAQSEYEDAHTEFEEADALATAARESAEAAEERRRKAVALLDEKHKALEQVAWQLKQTAERFRQIAMSMGQPDARKFAEECAGAMLSCLVQGMEPAPATQVSGGVLGVASGTRVAALPLLMALLLTLALMIVMIPWELQPQWNLGPPMQ